MFGSVPLEAALLIPATAALVQLKVVPAIELVAVYATEELLHIVLVVALVNEGVEITEITIGALLALVPHPLTAFTVKLPPVAFAAKLMVIEFPVPVMVAFVPV